MVILLKTLSPRARFFRLRRGGQRVALLPQLANDGRERRRIDLRSARLSSRARLIYVYKDGGTHALVAEAREDLERRAAEVRVQQVAHFLHGCVGDER